MFSAGQSASGKMAMPPLLLLFLFCSGCSCLHVEQLSIPPFANLGQPVTMGCSFYLGSARLYSVKWYKDNDEFCRYMPSQHPPSQLFPARGVVMDENGCQMGNVQLREATLETTGVYLCEVSTESPNFETDVRLANLTVRALPSESPHISNIHSSYSPGEWVLATCTAAKSLPAAHLLWQLNGLPVDNLWVTTSVIRSTGNAGGDEDDDLLLDSGYFALNDRTVEHLLPKEDEPHLAATKSVIRFQARPEYFTGPQREFSLRCDSSINEHKWRAERRATLTGLGGNQRLRHEEPYSSAATTSVARVWQVLLVLLLRMNL